MSTYKIPYRIGESNRICFAQYGLLEFFRPVDIDSVLGRIEIGGKYSLPADEEGSSPILCIIDVPDIMIPTEFLMFIHGNITSMVSMKVFRHYFSPEKYLVLLSMDSIQAADNFIKYYHGQVMSSLHNVFCQILKVKSLNGIEWQNVSLSLKESLVGFTEDSLYSTIFEETGLSQGDGVAKAHHSKSYEKVCNLNILIHYISLLMNQ